MLDNQMWPLITQFKRSKSWRNNQLFKYPMSSAPGDIIGIFTTFEGWPPDALNAHSFIRVP